MIRNRKEIIEELLDKNFILITEDGYVILEGEHTGSILPINGPKEDFMVQELLQSLTNPKQLKRKIIEHQDENTPKHKQLKLIPSTSHDLTLESDEPPIINTNKQKWAIIKRKETLGSVLKNNTKSLGSLLNENILEKPISLDDDMDDELAQALDDQEIQNIVNNSDFLTLTDEDIERNLRELENTIKQTKPTTPSLVITQETENLWTFIYRGPKPIFNNYKGDVITIDHLDHYHFVFHGIAKNRKRTITRIFEAGNMDKSQLSEGIKTCIPVLNWPKFAAYLVRKDAKIHMNGKKLEHLYVDLLNIPDSDKECADLYRELRKSSEKPTSVLRRQRTNYIMDLIRLYDSRQMDQFENMLSSSQRLDLYNEFGNQWQEVTKLCIKVYNEELVKDQKDKPYEEYEGDHEECTHPIHFEESNKWFDELFSKNDIDPREFCSVVKLVMNKKIKRKNALCIEGPTTTAKTMILKLICGEYNYGTVQRSGDHSQFFLQNLLKKTVALMEEPRITPITVNDFKQLLGGESFDIHVKHQEDARLERLPVLISTNHDLGYYISSIDKEAIYARTWRFYFTKRVGADIREPPCTLCCCHWRSYLQYVQTSTYGPG